MIDGKMGLNPMHERKNGDGWVVAATGAKPETHKQPEPEITHFVDAIKRAAQIKENDEKIIQHLRETSLTDDLTNCYNTRYFIKFATEEFDVNRDDHRIAIVNIDINGLKKINDELGHVKGDALINNFVAYMRSQLRKGDVLIRVGGDEFIIICENTKNDPNFEYSLEFRMNQINDNSPQSDIPEENISFAHGVSLFKKNEHKDLYDTRAIADALMYKRKREMKNKLNNSLATLFTEKTGGIDVKEMANKIGQKIERISHRLKKIFKGE